MISLIGKTIFRLSPNLTLAWALLFSLFIIYRQSRARDFPVEQVLDWVLEGIFFAFLPFLLFFSLPWSRWSWISPSLLSLLLTGVRQWAGEIFLLFFLVFSFFQLRRWRWPWWPPLDFISGGALFFFFFLYLLFPSWRPLWLRQWELGFRFSPLGPGLGLLAAWGVERRWYRPGRVTIIFLLATMKEALLLTALPLLVILEKAFWQKLARQGWILVKKLKTMPQPKKQKKQDLVEDLKEEEQELSERLDELEKEEDPRNWEGRTTDNAPEDDAEEAEVSHRVSALKEVIRRRLNNVRNVLSKLKRGSYGLCDRCGKKINPARLKAQPEARFCLQCAKEMEKNESV